LRGVMECSFMIFCVLLFRQHGTDVPNSESLREQASNSKRKICVNL
jgi:hypothetical protein